MTHQFTVSTRARAQLVEITEQVASAVRESGAASGVVHVFVPHTTAGITINENADPAVGADLLAALERMAPDGARYSHGEGNSPAHVKASLMGCCQTVLFQDRALVLGAWQGIYLCEFDGPRTRRVAVNIHADAG
ncbi:MAG TPA: secondary thiamine-phosphate synthase enzyme YjbQ [Armatimonadota bacterium]|nr:secondary thiamine-phosphate synthase enzyme YjbQ [Armatimonadota bacterium]